MSRKSFLPEVLEKQFLENIYRETVIFHVLFLLSYFQKRLAQFRIEVTFQISFVCTCVSVQFYTFTYVLKMICTGAQ